MLRKVLIIMSAFALLSVTAVAASADGTHHYGPIASTSPDSGTCGNDWANDTFERHFTVSNDGTRVTEEFKKGTFVTTAGPSPGACQSGPNNGHVVAAGVTGKLEGSFTIVVTGGTFNPSATCSATTCDTTAGFIATVFGPSATYDVPTFEFHYSAGRNGEWKNASADRGGNHGDIFTS